MVLGQLLKSLPADSYCLISRHSYENHEQVGSYYQLKTPLASPARLSGWQRRRFPAILRKILGLTERILRRIKNQVTVVALSNAEQEIEMRARQIHDVLRAEQCKALIACTGDLYDLPAGYLASRRAGVAFIPYLFDDYAYQWTGAQRAFSLKQEPAIVKHAKRVIVTNEYMAAEYKRRYDVAYTLIRNPSILPDLETLDLSTPYFERRALNIVYTGSVYHAQFDAFRNLIAAIHGLLRSDDSSRVILHIFTSQPASFLAANGVVSEAIVLHDHIAHEEIPIVQRHADILFLPLAFASPIPEVIRTSAPGKMGEYLSVGRPILVHAPEDTFVAAYFREHQCGLVVDRNDVSLLVQAIRRLTSEPELCAELSDRARRRAAEDFDVCKVQQHFVELLQSLGKGPPVQ